MDKKKQFLKEIKHSIQVDSFVKLTLSQYCGREQNLKKIVVRPLEIKGETKLSFTYQYQTRDIIKNFLPKKGVDIVTKDLGKIFASANLFTTERNLQIQFSKSSPTKLSTSKPTCTTSPSKSHDRKKVRCVEPEGNIYLNKLGITNSSGRILPKQGAKYRQVDKFIEILAGLYHSSNLVGKKSLQVVDMGSGKGLLTFAVYDYLNSIPHVKAHVAGIEVREDLVSFCNNIALQIGFDQLQFKQGSIKDYQADRGDILIALHACDTATDEAIYKGIETNCSIIICAPCCHKQIRKQLVPPPELEAVLEHGILLERQAEMVTDVLRAVYLELHGYETKVFEFISTEHTHKNLMITGVKHKHDKAVKRKELLAKIADLKDTFGVHEFELEKLLLAGDYQINDL